MPRRNYPRKRRGRGPASSSEEPSDTLRALDLIAPAPDGWMVRLIQPASAVKEYRCPGCNQEIRTGMKHVVAWREDEPDLRRHWHAGCWDRKRS